MIVNWLIFLVCKQQVKQPEKLTKKLALIELGIACYCRKMACELDPLLIPANPNHDHAKRSNNELAIYLFDQYIEERKHGQMLAAIINEPSWKNGGIGQVRIPTQIASKVEGLSNVKVFQYLFNGKNAEHLDLPNRLAMMSILEKYSERFYKNLATCLPDSPLKRIVTEIAHEERNHNQQLKYFLFKKTTKLKAILMLIKWEIKVLLALPIAIESSLKFAKGV